MNRVGARRSACLTLDSTELGFNSSLLTQTQAFMLLGKEMMHPVNLSGDHRRILQTLIYGWC